MSKYDEILSNITLQIENGRQRRLRRLEKVIPRTAASSRSKNNSIGDFHGIFPSLAKSSKSCLIFDIQVTKT